MTKEHQNLRAELEALLHVSDFGAVHAFEDRLAVRRRQLGFRYEQFDGRKWGYLWDDTLYHSEDEGDDSQYEVWNEATDPSNGAVLNPASDATIKSLPVKK